MFRALLFTIVCFCCNPSLAGDVANARAHYLGNAGVMIEHGDTKVLFDPFFRNGYDVYDLVPAELEASIFAGAPPYDGIDAIFASHYHGDHFNPAVVLEYLMTWTDVEFYAPAQAADALLALVETPAPALLNRVHSLTLRPDSGSTELALDALQIEAVYIAHAGWPERHAQIHNIAFRVTLADTTTVMHLGDADAGDRHYAQHGEFWQERDVDLALPPVWLMLTDKGRHSLGQYVDARHEIGVHVYSDVADDADDREPKFDGLDIFTRPGETRQLPD